MPERPIAEITRINRKQSSGEALTPEERRYKTEYERKDRDKKHGVYLPPDKYEEWMKRASAEGIRSFSAYVRHGMREFHRGNSQELREKEETIKALQHQFDVQRTMLGEATLEIGAKNVRLESMERTIADALKAARDAGATL